MPYVKQERRPALDKVIEELVKAELKPGEMKKFLISFFYRGAPIQSSYCKPKLIPALEKAYKADMKPNGDINYILFKYCKYHVKPSYNNYKDFMGEIYNTMDYVVTNYKDEFREAAEWIRIKILTPYEAKKEQENGDV